MRFLSFLERLEIVAFGYAGVFVVAAGLLYGQHLRELSNPVDAAGGVWAFGSLILYIFIICLFMIPTILLLLLMASVESFYTVCSQLLFGLSLSAPVCLAVLWFGEHHVAESFSNLCLIRLLWSPFLLVGIGVSRLIARFDRAKKLFSYALLIEGLTLGIAVVLLAETLGH